MTVLAGLAGTCATGLRAEVASGTYTNTFTDAVRIWDVSGSFNDGVAGLSLNYSLNMDDAGKFRGQGAVSAGGMDMDLYYWGSVKNISTNVTRVTLAMKLKGAVDLDGHSMTFSATLKENMEVDAVTRTMIGTASGSVHVSVMGHSASQSIPPTDVQLPLPLDMTGNWDLTLNVVPSGNRYTGDAEMKLSNGRTVPLVVAGSYNAKTDVSKLNLKSTGTGGIVRLGVTSGVAGGQINIEKLIGKALGQTIKSETQ